MEDNQVNKLYRGSSFFQPSKFKMFVQDIGSLPIPIQAKAIQ